MPTSGRKPSPTHLKLVRGTARRDRINQAEAKPRMGALTPPAHLSARAKAAWKAVAPKLQRLGLLTELDNWALAAACEAYADLAAARAALKAAGGGLTYESATPTGVIVRPRPELRMISDADRRFRQWLTEFGLTPAARSRVTADPPREEDPAEAFFGP
jgi:P27 family predicted phage terminase small subunit